MAFGNAKLSSNDSLTREEIKARRQQSMFGGPAPDVQNTELYTGTITMLPMDRIDLYKENDKTFNMKKVPAIADSIQKFGYNEACPVVVVVKNDGRFELIEGHTRFLAMKSLNRDMIPAVIKTFNDSTEIVEQWIMSNINNREFTALDWAKAMQSYIDDVYVPRRMGGIKRKAVADFFHKGETTVQRYLSLLNLIPELQQLADDNRVPYTALSNAVNLSEARQKELYREVMSELERQELTEGFSDISTKRLKQMIDSLKRLDMNEEKSKLINEEKRAVEGLGVKDTCVADHSADTNISVKEFSPVSTVSSYQAEQGISENEESSETTGAVEEPTNEMGSLSGDSNEIPNNDAAVSHSEAGNIVIETALNNLKELENLEISTSDTMIQNLTQIKHICDILLKKIGE